MQILAGDGLAGMQAQAADQMRSEAHLDHAIDQGGSQPDRLPGEGVAYRPTPPLPADFPGRVHPAHRVGRRGDEFRQHLREGARTRGIARQRRRQGERLMRSDLVVNGRQASKAAWAVARSAKRRSATMSARSVRLKRSSLPWVWGWQGRP